MIADVRTRPYRTMTGGEGTEVDYLSDGRPMCARLPWATDGDRFIRWLERVRKATPARN